MFDSNRTIPAWRENSNRAQEGTAKREEGRGKREEGRGKRTAFVFLLVLGVRG
jgi:hypothetical protein